MNAEFGKTTLMFSGFAALWAMFAWMMSHAAGRDPRVGEPNATAQAVAHWSILASDALWMSALALAILGGSLRLAWRTSVSGQAARHAERQAGGRQARAYGATSDEQRSSTLGRSASSRS
jgi:hypothetical protein